MTSNHPHTKKNLCLFVWMGLPDRAQLPVLCFRWTIDKYQQEVRQEKVHNTYYNNMLCYITYKQGNDTDSASKVNLSKYTKSPVINSNRRQILGQQMQSGRFEHCINIV